MAGVLALVVVILRSDTNCSAVAEIARKQIVVDKNIHRQTGSWAKIYTSGSNGSSKTTSCLRARW